MTGSAAVPRVSRVAGRLRVPGDKSISHRYAMLAAIADGDVAAARLRPGGRLRRHAGVPGGARRAESTRAAGAVTIDGSASAACAPRRARWTPPIPARRCACSPGLLAAHPFRSVIGGDASLSRRPMRRVIEPLTRMGASNFGRRRPAAPDDRRHASARYFLYPRGPERPGQKRGSAGGAACGGAHDRDRAGAHSGSYGAGPRMRSACGSFSDGTAVSVDGGQRLRAIEADVPGDISSAVFWLGAGRRDARVGSR